MSRTLNSIVGAALLSGVALGMTGCSSSAGSTTKVSWQSNGVPYYNEAGAKTWHYKFVYYPESNVYFEPHSATYYWNHNGLWNTGGELPAWYILQNEEPMVIRTASEYPVPADKMVASATTE